MPFGGRGCRPRPRGQRLAIRVPQLRGTGAIDPSECAAVAPSRGRLRQGPQRVEAEPVHQIRMESQPIRIHARGAGPGDQPQVDPVDGIEAAGSGGNAVDRSELTCAKPALRGEVAFDIRRQSLDLPAGQEQVREGQRRAAEHPTHQPGPAPRLVKVHDVGVLVYQQQPQPVVCAPDHTVSGRRRHVHEDDVPGQHRGEAVRIVPLVGQDNVRQLGSIQVQCGPDLAPHLFDHAGQAQGKRLLILMRVDDEMRCPPLDELQARVGRCLGECRRPRHHEDQREDCSQRHSPGRGAHG